MATNAPLPLTVAITNVAFFRKSTALKPLGWFAKQAERCNARLQWRPTYLPLVSLQLLSGWVSQETKDSIISVEESFKVQASIRQALKAKNKKVSIFSFFLFPHKDDVFSDSLIGIRRLRSVLGRDFPLTLYPELSSQGNQRRFAQLGFKTLLFQPHLHLWDNREITSAHDFKVLRDELGFTGFTLDFTHLLEFADKLGGWEAVCEDLTDFEEVHLGIRRYDLRNQNVDTRAIGEDLMDGGDRTPVMAFLRYLKAKKWQGPVTIETMPYAFGTHEETITALTKVVDRVWSELS